MLMYTLNLSFSSKVIKTILVDLVHVWIVCDRPKWISIYGERFYNQEFVLIGFQDDDLPYFGKIRDILMICGTPLFVIANFKTVCLYSHLSAYEVMQTNNESVVLITELTSRQPYYSHLYVGDCQTYIAMKSNVITH